MPPYGVHAVLAPPRAAQLTLFQIPYTGDGGYYEIAYATTPGGPLTRHGATADKFATEYQVGDLTPGQTYYFRVRTFTPAHGSPQNALTSAWSAQSEPEVVPLPASATPRATATPAATITRKPAASPTASATSRATPGRVRYFPVTLH